MHVIRKFILIFRSKLRRENHVDLSGFHDALRTSHWDSLEKALTIFVLPSADKRPRVHRLDLIFTAPEVYCYWTAVVG